MSGEQMFLGIKLQLDATGVVTGASLAGSSLDQLQSKTRQTGRAMAAANGVMLSDSMRVASGLGAIGLASSRAGDAVMNNFLAPAATQAKEFETEMSTLRFVTSGTAEEMERLKGIAIQTGLATQFSPQEAAAGIRMLKAAGLETELALSSLSATLDIVTGSAGTIQLQEGATATAAALLKFRGTGEDARTIMDAFAQSTRETNMQMGDLQGFIDGMRDAPTKLGMTAAEAFALGGVMRSSGKSTRNAALSMAMYADRIILAQRRVSRFLRRHKITEDQLFDPNFNETMPDAVYQFKKLGMHIFNANGSMKSATQILMEMTDRASALKKESQKVYLETASALLGPKSSSVLSALMLFKKNGLQGSAAFKALVDSIGGVKGASREAAAAVENTTAGMEKFIEGTNQTIAIIEGTTFLPAMQAWYKSLRSVLTAVLNHIEANPAFAKAIGATGVIFFVVAKAAGALALAIAASLMWTLFVVPAFGAAGGAATLFAAAITGLKFALLPLGYVALGIVAVFVAVRLALAFWAQVWSKDAKGFFFSLQLHFRKAKMVWEAFIAFVQGNSISEELADSLEAEGLMGFVAFLRLIATRAKLVFEGMIDGFKDAFIPVLFVFGLIGDALSWVIDLVWDVGGAFGGNDIRGAIPVWMTLGYLIGIIAAVHMMRLIYNTKVLIARTIPRLILGLKGVIAKLKLMIVKMGAMVSRYYVSWMASTVKVVKQIGLWAKALWGLIVKKAILLKEMVLVRLAMIKTWIVAQGQAIAAVFRMIAAQIVLKAQLIATWIVAGAKAVAQAVLMIAKNWILIAQYALMAVKLVLIAAAIILVVVAYGYLIMKAMEVGEKLGDAVYDWVNEATQGLMLLYLNFKEWGSEIANVFVEMFKGNFDPLFQYIDNAIALAKAAWSYAFGEGTKEEMKAAAAKLGITESTQRDRDKASAGAAALQRGSSVSAAMEGVDRVAGMKARIEQRNANVMEYNKVLQALAKQGRTVHIEKIELATQGLSPEEAARLAKQMAGELAKHGDNEAEVEFSQ